MNTFGHRFRLSIWGESHGPEVGITLDGVPPGLPLAPADFETDLARRRGGAPGTTPRREADIPQIVSGLYAGHTTGAPLTLRFENANTRPGDYADLDNHYRPSHADFTASRKFGGRNDPRGGGHFSARLTVALVAAGVVAKKCLGESVRFATRLVEVGGESDPARFDERVAVARKAGDSVGGLVECCIAGVKAGTGEPFFDSVESVAAHLLFSIPAVKAVAFGAGFDAARMCGSEYNDPILGADGRTATNHDGGINGGIANGNEIVVRVAVKPTPSIAREQHTYNSNTGRIEPLAIRGRHDACVALRGAVVVEAALAIALADLTL